MNVRLHRLLTVLFALYLWISGSTTFAQSIEEQMRKAREAYSGGNYVQVEAICREVIQDDPSNVEAHTFLGLVLYDQGKLDEAIENYRTAIKLDPKSAAAYSNLGNALQNQGKLDEAVENYQKAIELDPNNSTIYYNLGLALHDQKKLDEAIESYQQAIQLAPNDAKTYYNLGLALYDQEKLDEAIENYQKAIELDLKDANLHINLGIALYEIEKPEEAATEYQKAIELDPNSEIAKSNLREIEALVALPEEPVTPPISQEPTSPTSPIDDTSHVPTLEDEPLRNILRPTARITSYYGSDGFRVGAGWVVKREGDTAWIITCDHVISNRLTKRPSQQVEVEFFSELKETDRPRYQAAIVKIGTSDQLDLALLKVTQVPDDIKPLEMDVSRMALNTPIKAIGHPINNPDQWISSSGEISSYSLNKALFSINATLAAGNSGGPIVHAESQKVVGILVSIYDSRDVAVNVDATAPTVSIGSPSTGGFGVAYRIEVVIKSLREWGVLS